MYFREERVQSLKISTQKQEKRSEDPVTFLYRERYICIRGIDQTFVAPCLPGYTLDRYASSHTAIEIGRYCLVKELTVVFRYLDESNSHSSVYDPLIRDVDVGPDNLRVDRQGVMTGSIDGQTKSLAQGKRLMAADKCTTKTDIFYLCLYRSLRGLHLDRPHNIGSLMLALLLLNGPGQLPWSTILLAGDQTSLEIGADKGDEQYGEDKDCSTKAQPYYDIRHIHRSLTPRYPLRHQVSSLREITAQPLKSRPLRPCYLLQ